MLSSDFEWMGICEMSKLSIETENNIPLKIVVVGHVDHGKSTLIGRLFHDTGSLPEGKIEAIQEMCRRRGMDFEWAFLMDAFKAERDQGLTIDTAQIRFRSELRDYVLIDAPGHREFLKNMVTGAASADAAILVVDVKEGMQEQTRRHGYLLHLLGIQQVVVAMNKMDLVEWSESRYLKVMTDCLNYLISIGLDSGEIKFVPISARHGDGIANTSDKMDFCKGLSILSALDEFKASLPPVDLPLRFPVQDVYKFDERRIVVGRLESGSLQVGDELFFSPSNKSGRIPSLENWGQDEQSLSAQAGQSIAMTLEPPIFIERGQVGSLGNDVPILSNVCRAKIFWLGENPLIVGNKYKLKLNSAEYQVEVEAIEHVVEVESLGELESGHVDRNGVAEVVFRSRTMMAIDEYRSIPSVGRFVLVEDYDIVGGGLVSMNGFEDQRNKFLVKSTNIHHAEHRVDAETRWAMNGHKGGILWLTGLSGSGKSTLAFSLEQQLVAKGYQVFVLDGDNVRHGLCSDLAFSPEDRSENIRRVGEVALLFADAGFVVIAAFISPYLSDRERIRMIGPELFHEVFIDASLELCEQRDPKGLYKKARSGEIDNFTGISAPYEPPNEPSLVIDTGRFSVDEGLDLLTSYVSENFKFPA